MIRANKKILMIWTAPTRSTSLHPSQSYILGSPKNKHWSTWILLAHYKPSSPLQTTICMLCVCHFNHSEPQDEEEYKEYCPPWPGNVRWKKLVEFWNNDRWTGLLIDSPVFQPLCHFALKEYPLFKSFCFFLQSFTRSGKNLFIICSMI